MIHFSTFLNLVRCKNKNNTFSESFVLYRFSSWQLDYELEISRFHLHMNVRTAEQTHKHKRKPWERTCGCSYPCSVLMSQWGCKWQWISTWQSTSHGSLWLPRRPQKPTWPTEQGWYPFSFPELRVYLTRMSWYRELQYNSALAYNVVVFMFRCLLIVSSNYPHTHARAHGNAYAYAYGWAGYRSINQKCNLLIDGLWNQWSYFPRFVSRVSVL